jgi:hypothetical protein
MLNGQKNGQSFEELSDEKNNSKEKTVLMKGKKKSRRFLD